MDAVPDRSSDPSRVLIVTGASRGIGAAIARLAAQRGYTVCVNYRERKKEADEVVRSIEQQNGDALAVQADISVEADVVRLFETVDREMGPLSALVNNAATIDRQTRLDTMEAARLHRMFATNVIGTFLCSREAVRRMSTRHGGMGGAIVNVSSAAARLGGANEYVDYAASKGAVDTLTIGLAKEVAQEGIRVNAVRPGLIYTELHARAAEPERVDRLKKMVAMKRGGQPEEIAAAVLWLLSDEASYTTGAILDVTGGR
jgi:NAD(P)-dependent dehydrogenase (short-subunit alcohol dehydrogenase family)